MKCQKESYPKMNHDCMWSNQILSKRFCQKSIPSEKSFKLIVKDWVSVYGKTTTPISDIDVRLTQFQSFYSNAFEAMDIKTIFTTPYHRKNEMINKIR